MIADFEFEAFKLHKAKRNFWEMDFNIKSSLDDFSMSQDFHCDSDECSEMTKFCYDLLSLLLGVSISIDFTYIYSIPIFSFLDFGIIIHVSIEPEICIGFGYTYNLKDSEENSFDIDISGGITVDASIDFGLFFPSADNPIKLAFEIGLGGTLVSGRIGVKLSFYSNNKYAIDTYFEFKAYEFTFYVKFELSFEIRLLIFSIKFSFSFYLYQIKFTGLNMEFHLKFINKYKKALS